MTSQHWFNGSLCYIVLDILCHYWYHIHSAQFCFPFNCYNITKRQNINVVFIAQNVSIKRIYHMSNPLDAYVHTVYPKKYAHGFVVLCFVVVMQSFIMNSPGVFIHIHQGCFAGTGAIVRLPQCQWSKPAGYGNISQCITTTKHSKAKTVYIFLGIYCIEKWVLELEHTFNGQVLCLCKWRYWSYCVLIINRIFI